MGERTSMIIFSSRMPVLLCFGFLLLGVFLCGPLQADENDLHLKVSVEEVRIDAVVLDGEGRQVKDLSAEDFEIKQDKKVQKIISCTYINESADGSRIPVRDDAAGRKGSFLTKDQVRRTIVFVVDDLVMGFSQLNNTRMALEKFLETQMQPGDLVAIFKTSRGGGGGWQFSSDKRELRGAIKDLRWGDPIALTMNASVESSDVDYPGKGITRGRDPGMDPSDFAVSAGGTSAATLLYSVTAEEQNIANRAATERQIAVLRHIIRALKAVPGRKSLMFMSPRIEFTVQPTNPRSFAPGFYEQAFNEIADDALRAGVVIYTLDMKGLNPDYQIDPNAKYLPFSKKTGGLIIENSNFFVKGLGPAEEPLKGYYLLSFVPPEGTFVQNGREKYHKVQIKTRRSGLRVLTRDGYYGVSSRGDSDGAADELQTAITSPFRYNDLNLRMSAGYLHATDKGYLLRSWLHLDGEDLQLAEAGDEYLLSLDLATFTSNSSGNVRGARGLRYNFRIRKEDVPDLRRAGIDFDMYMPVERPGDYYVRTAIRDRASGKTGSAYQFLPISENKKKSLALSSLFIFNWDDDVAVVRAGRIDKERASAETVRQWQLTPNSPAIRIYKPGESFNYMTVVRGLGNFPAARLDTQVALFRNGKEISRSAAQELNFADSQTAGRLPVVRKVVLDPAMEEGEYLLEFSVIDRSAKKNAVVIQAVDFEIRKNSDR